MGNDWFHEYFINELKAIGRKPTSNMQHEVVDSLPSSGNEQTIYFVKNDSSSSNNHYDEYVWISSSSTFEKIGSTQTDGSATQPDWNQNDDTRPDYVKNRPFYTDDHAETVFVEETTLPFEDGGAGIYVALPQLAFDAIVGDTYKVTWDGTVYESVCLNFQDVIIIGNLSIMGEGSDTGEPFLIVTYREQIQIATADTGSSHTISISGWTIQVVKIDPKYLDQSDWNQNDVNASSYIKNRPFYTDYTEEKTLIKQSRVVFKEHSGLYLGSLRSTFTPIVGDTYKVTWDGTVYESVCLNFQDAIIIGNLSIMGEGSDTGEPFLIVVGNIIDIHTPDTASSHVISISGRIIQVVKIDEKYLPILPKKPKGKFYLTFSSPSEFTLQTRDNKRNWDGTLEYFASDNTWTTWDGSYISAVANGCEYVLYLRGIGNSVINKSGYWNLSGTNIKCIGNIENLLDYAIVESGNHPIMGDYCYNGMFSDCTSLTQAPDLPAITLAPSCYHSMFYGCTSLTQAPVLPATTLAELCYQRMFDGCTSLTQAPALPATTLSSKCYSLMFRDCTSLTQAPVLPATTLAGWCYRSMFNNCTSLTQAPDLPATTLVDWCYNEMFSGCTNLKLSSTKTNEYMQEYRIPSSGNGTSATNALIDMFTSTGGTFTGTPEINTTYYLSSDNMIIRETELATLNGHVKAMIKALEYIIPSSTEGSTKKFKITVDDTGTISATEVI